MESENNIANGCERHLAPLASMDCSITEPIVFEQNNSQSRSNDTPTLSRYFDSDQLSDLVDDSLFEMTDVGCAPKTLVRDFDIRRAGGNHENDKPDFDQPLSIMENIERFNPRMSKAQAEPAINSTEVVGFDTMMRHTDFISQPWPIEISDYCSQARDGGAIFTKPIELLEGSICWQESRRRQSGSCEIRETKRLPKNVQPVRMEQASNEEGLSSNSGIKDEFDAEVERTTEIRPCYNCSKVVKRRGRGKGFISNILSYFMGENSNIRCDKACYRDLSQQPQNGRKCNKCGDISESSEKFNNLVDGDAHTNHYQIFNLKSRDSITLAGKRQKRDASRKTSGLSDCSKDRANPEYGYLSNFNSLYNTTSCSNYELRRPPDSEKRNRNCQASQRPTKSVKFVLQSGAETKKSRSQEQDRYVDRERVAQENIIAPTGLNVRKNVAKTSTCSQTESSKSLDELLDRYDLNNNLILEINERLRLIAAISSPYSILDDKKQRQMNLNSVNESSKNENPSGDVVSCCGNVF